MTQTRGIAAAAHAVQLRDAAKIGFGRTFGVSLARSNVITMRRAFAQPPGPATASARCADARRCRAEVELLVVAAADLDRGRVTQDGVAVAGGRCGGGWGQDQGAGFAAEGESAGR